MEIQRLFSDQKHMKKYVKKDYHSSLRWTRAG